MSMMVGEQLQILSANCQGLRDRTKRLDVLNYFLQLNPNIICLQDTHLTADDENLLKLTSYCNCFISGSRTNARGVAILLKFYWNITLRTINIYAPNTDTPSFFFKL